MATDRKESLSKRLCFVCRGLVPEGQGTWHTGYNILIHRGVCTEMVAREERVYDRSKRGRWRSTSEVLANIRAQRPQALGALAKEHQ